MLTAGSDALSPRRAVSGQANQSPSNAASTTAAAIAPKTGDPRMRAKTT